MSEQATLSAPTLLSEIDEPPPPRKRWPFSPVHLILFPIALVMAVPLFWMLITSVQSYAETQRYPPVFFPKVLEWSNYTFVLQQAPFGRWFLNTAFVTLAAVIGNLVFCSLAGYAFARIKFFGREFVFVLILVSLMIPFQVVMIPTFLIVKHLGGVDKLWALAIPYLVDPFGIFLMRQFFRTLPVELEEAARIDGASRLGILFKILLPLSGPVLATLAVIEFMWTWNDFLWPLIICNTDACSTIQLGLTTFSNAHTSNVAALMAANVMSMAPVLLLFFFAQRYFIRGIATTGLKG